MGALCDTMKGASTDVWRWFFPAKIDPPDCVLELLRFIYPTVDWSRVSFHDGWPHVIGFSPNVAITLPDTYTPHRINVYFKPGRWDPCTCGGVGLIVHEGFHVLQLQDMLGGWGLGFERPFIVEYLACWAANGFKYDNHPMEDAAYAVAGRGTSLFESCCDATRLPCDCSTDPPSANTAGLAQFQADCAHVVQWSSGISFWKDLAACTPGLMAIHRAAQWLFRRTCGSRDEGSVGVAVPSGPGPGPTDPDAEEPPRVPEPETATSRGIAVPRRWIACFFGLIGAGLLYVVFGLYYLVWAVLWSAVTIVLWLLKIVVEIIGAIVAGILWVITGIACALEWLWERLKDLWRWFKGVLGKACDLVEPVGAAVHEMGGGADQEVHPDQGGADEEVLHVVAVLVGLQVVGLGHQRRLRRLDLGHQRRLRRLDLGGEQDVQGIHLGGEGGDLLVSDDGGRPDSRRRANPPPRCAVP